MLDHFHGQHHVEALLCGGEVLSRGGAVVNRNATLKCMRGRHCDVLLGRIGPDHLRTKPRQGLGQNTGAAADIEHAQAVEAVELLGVAVKARRGLIADIAEPDGIELVQRRHRPARIPPTGGQAREALHFGSIDA